MRRCSTLQHHRTNAGLSHLIDLSWRGTFRSRSCFVRLWQTQFSFICVKNTLPRGKARHCTPDFRIAANVFSNSLSVSWASLISFSKSVRVISLRRSRASRVLLVRHTVAFLSRCACVAAQVSGRAPSVVDHALQPSAFAPPALSESIPI